MIITLCGSTRFEKEYRAIERGLALDRHLVFTVSWYKGMDIEESIKDDLDSVHLEKIAKSDAIVVINKDGYIGDSTRREINFAVQMMKTVYYLEAPDMQDEKVRKIIEQYGFDNRVERWLRAGMIDDDSEVEFPKDKPAEIAVAFFNNHIMPTTEVFVSNRRDGGKSWIGKIQGAAFIIEPATLPRIGSIQLERGLRGGMPVVQVEGMTYPVCIDEVFPSKVSRKISKPGDKCRHCGGTGTDDSGVPCDPCKGSGIVPPKPSVDGPIRKRG